MTHATSDNETDRHAQKARLRSRLRGTRAALDPQDRADQAEELRRQVLDHVRSTITPADDSGPTTIAAYLGVAPEPDTIALLTALTGLGHSIIVPVCEPQYHLSWASWTPGVALERSVRAHVGEPVGPRLSFDEVPGVRLILVPALGVDRTGNRLGQGGGYYDRFLSGHRHDAPDALPRFGVVYRSEILAAGEVPAEPFDQPLHGVFTPDGLLRFGGDAQPV